MSLDVGAPVFGLEPLEEEEEAPELPLSALGGPGEKGAICKPGSRPSQGPDLLAP